MKHDSVSSRTTTIIIKIVSLNEDLSRLEVSGNHFNDQNIQNCTVLKEVYLCQGCLSHIIGAYGLILFL